MTDFRTGLNRVLSPSAQAVFDAGDIGFTHHRVMIGEALKAAAEQLSYCLDGSNYYVVAKDELLAIADELVADE